jgi:TonB family protein
MLTKSVQSGLLIAIFASTIIGSSWAADDDVRVVPESELKLWWQSDPSSSNLPAVYPVEALRNTVESCVAVAFEIHSDGTVSNERVWNSNLTDPTVGKQLRQSALLTAHQWRYVPAPANTGRTPVYTYLVITFILKGGYRGSGSAREAKLKSQCEMSDFPQQVQAMINAGTAAKGGTQ